MNGGGETPASAPTPDDTLAARLLDAARAAEPGVGERLGAYELIDEIARGTHARVFRARQREPVERELAVKVLSASSPSTSLAARFARERALLARIAHPGVVPLLDAGESGERGVAWFAMPLVDGLPIDRWCSRNSAPRAIRLRLLEEAARAVAAAHALGVVHRDLKPSNILVSGGLADPRIHVIDFGVAKILGDERETGGDGTRAGAVVGTPEFMSPEQADLDAARISPASDVFALGLVGYLLLGGAVQGVSLGADSDARSRAPVGQRLRIASEREIAPISQTSGDRALRGEIEWILARACARDPARRYANAAEFADDLARLREGRAIVAAPRDSGYEAMHLLSRYRAGIAVALAVVLGLVAIGFFRADAQRRIAEHERARADAEQARREQLERVLEKARVQLEPLTGRRAGSIVDNQKALELAQTLHEVNIAALGELAVESQQSAFVLANALDRSDRHEEALAVFQRLLELAEPEPDRERDRPFLRMNVGALMTKIGPTRAAEAVVVLERALGEYEALPTRNPTECGCMAYLGKALDDLGRHADARARFERAIACEERFSRQGTVTYAVQIGFLADHLRAAGEFDAARARYEQALAVLPARASPGTPEAATEHRLIADRWRDSWTGEIAWMSVEAARMAGRAPSDAEWAVFVEVVDRVTSYDASNDRLPRWITARAAREPAASPARSAGEP